MAWSWTGFRRKLFGWETFDTLEEFHTQCQTISDVADYAWSNFEWEEDHKPADEWQEPHQAFANLQSSDTPSDCDDFTTVYDSWCVVHGLTHWMIAVWWGKGEDRKGHAVCVTQDYHLFSYFDNKTLKTGFTSIQAVCRDIASTADYACYVNRNLKTGRYVYGASIPLPKI